MESRIEAIYENGVFRPLGAVVLPDRSRVVLKVENGAEAADEEAAIVAIQKQAMAELDAELEHIPDNSPDDGFSAEDHDRILYGEPR
jgi:predicted DNA-binding antitoxin AbrB/MazE fold protein